MSFISADYISKSEYVSRFETDQYKYDERLSGKNTVRFASPEHKGDRGWFIVHHDTKIIHYIPDAFGMTWHVTCHDSKTTRERINEYTPDWFYVVTHNHVQYLNCAGVWYFINSERVEVRLKNDETKPSVAIGGQKAMPLKRGPWDKMLPEEKQIRRILFKARDSWGANNAAFDDMPALWRDTLSGGAFAWYKINDEDRSALIPTLKIAAALGPTRLWGTRQNVLMFAGYPWGDI